MANTEQSQKVQSLPPASTGEDVEAEDMSIVAEGLLDWVM